MAFVKLNVHCEKANSFPFLEPKVTVILLSILCSVLLDDGLFQPKYVLSELEVR
jgi:hypothetical protein